MVEGFIGAVFHVGYVVEDLEQSMSELSQSHGLRWAGVITRDSTTMWTATGERTFGALSYVYSIAGPQRVELLKGAPGSPWDPATSCGLHHMGVWGDVGSMTRHLLDEQWHLEYSKAGPTEGYGSYVYLRSPLGLRVEVVDHSSRPRLERWWAGT